MRNGIVAGRRRLSERGVWRARAGRNWLWLVAVLVAALAGTAAAQEDARDLNTLPERFEDRLLFPVEEQAVAMANGGVELPTLDADLERGGIAGIQEMPTRQIYLDAGPGRPQLRDTENRRFDEPVTILLSKFRYPWEDRHLDAIVWTTPPEGGTLEGSLEVILKDAEGDVLARHGVEELSPNGLFFSVGFPDALRGSEGALEVVWRQGGGVVGRAEQAFHVRPPEDVEWSRRIQLRILNEPGATISNAPMTVGVPFPRGALDDEANVRLVDEDGAEMPLQTRTTARWSRFGSVKWLLCDFTADLAGEPRVVYLEYGPEVSRQPVDAMPVAQGASGFPRLDAGRLHASADEGLSFDLAGDGTHWRALAPAALRGAFVRHEDGRLYTVPADLEYTVEESGSEKTVLRGTGWYVEEATGERFCNFVTRLVFHRDSPVVRVFHTWIFTGDGNNDRIRDMGWRFGAAEGMNAEGILTSFEGGEWAAQRYLVQFDHANFLLADQAAEREGRAPGVLSARVGDGRVLFGAKDFWQNFPSELEFDGDAFVFHNWPRHNPAARFERPVTREKAFLHRFAHEGELLDFRLPQEYTEGRIWQESSSREGHWAEGRPETTNAQGIARTEEMFLYLTDDDPDEAARVLRGLNDDSLRAVADPQWVAYSGALGELHHRDTKKFAESEEVYEQVVHAPARWNERLGFYGMWVHGDVPAWGINLEDRTVSLYRTMRKNHHGWPVAWIPFARSGDPQQLKYAETATRQLIDANFCHFATADVDASVGPDHFRRQGWWDRSLLQWAARRGPALRTYTVDCDYIWHAYYLTGYTRARDVALLFGKLTQHDHGAPRGPRTTSSMLPSYLDMYQATFDPWFLSAAHDMAELHRLTGGRVHQEQRYDEPVDKYTHRTVGHFWRPADIDFQEFTGSDEFRQLAVNHAMSTSSPRSYGGGGHWPRLSVPMIPQAVFAYAETGDPFHLDRAAAYVDRANIGVYDGDVEYGRGTVTQGGTARGIFTGYYIRQFPLALGAIERAGHKPAPSPNPFFMNSVEVGEDESAYEFRLPQTLIRKGSGEVALLLVPSDRTEDVAYDYHLAGPAGREYKSGSWSLWDRGRDPVWGELVDIPADAPEGVYSLRLSGSVPYPDDTYESQSRVRRRHGRALFPVAPPDVPEVIVFDRDDEGTTVATGGPEIQYWFRVPEEVSEFWIDFRGGTSEFNRVSVWNPDGERVWDRSFTGTTPDRALIEVPPQDAGRLWRASGGGFVIDPQIPPYFSISREKWFDPEMP